MPSRKKRRKDPFRQLRLGATDNNELTLVKFVKRTEKAVIHYEADIELFSHLPFYDLTDYEVVITLRPPFPILRLPKELVSQILTEAVHTGYQKSRWSPYRKMYKVPLALCAVCKVFRTLVQPLLYFSMTVPLYGQDVPSDGSSNTLYHPFQTDFSMTRHCRELLIRFSSSWPHDIDATTVVLSRFVNAHRLTIEGLFDNTVGNGEFSKNNLDLWAFIRLALPYTSRVKELYISTRCGGFAAGQGLPLYPLCATIGSIHAPNLRSLQIYGISPRVDGSSFILPKSLEGTANFTDLTIHACEEGPSALTELMKWPRALRSFSSFEIHWYPSRGFLHNFRSILYRHIGSLKSLSITNVPGTAAGPLDLSDFMSLEVVRLFSRTMTDKWTPETLCDNILAAPRLHHLIWDFSLFDEQVGPCTSCQDFGAAEAEWLQKVARLADRRRLALRKIEIIFDPYDLHYHLHSGETSPWDWMEDVRVELESTNIELLAPPRRKIRNV